MSSPSGTLVFHSASPIDEAGASGSSIRPVRMLRAMQTLGVPLFVIDGYSKQRIARWKELARSNLAVVGIYSELSTMPIGLSDADHLPRHPFYDMSMFRRLRLMGLPVGVFYRDVYWRFPEYQVGLSWYKRRAANAAYLVELAQIRRSTSCVFLPSMRMRYAIPNSLSHKVLHALPPGGIIQEHKSLVKSSVLHFLYVGGVRPPLYDLAPMLLAIAKLRRVKLTLCCRESEWLDVVDLYPRVENLEVVHLQGQDVARLFSEADVFIMYREMCEYLSFAMPVKLFEAIGAGLPVITNADSEMGDFVQHEGAGWAIRSQKELESLLARLVEQPRRVRAVAERVVAVRERHTWRARAEEVIKVLEHYRQRGRAG